MENVFIGAAFVFLVTLLFPKRAKGAPGPDDLDLIDDPSVAELSYLGRSDLPRGIRNNNPGNIEQGPSKWMGKVPQDQNTDPRFEQFTNYVYGVRAMIRLIRDTYIDKREFNTIELIIHKYAPASENNTRAYINAVANKTGFAANEILSTDYGVIKPLIQAMADHENGWKDAVTDQMFYQAWKIS